MAEDLFVDVRYHGLELGRRSRIEDVAAASAYLHHPAPMPVGSSLVLEADDSLEIAVRVTRVSEQVAGNERPPGMFVEPQELSGKAEQWWNARVAAADSSESEAAPENGAEPVRDTEEMPVPVSEASASAEPVRDTEEMPVPVSEPPEAEPEAKPKKKKRAKRKKSK